MYPRHSTYVRLLAQLAVHQWLIPSIGGGKYFLQPLLFLALTILGACTTDPVESNPYDTRTATDSTQAGGSPGMVVDTTWADTLHHNFDNDSLRFELPDSVPLGDAGNAA